MGTEAWNAMEALATRMTNARLRKEKVRREKLEELRKFNAEHPVPKSPSIVVYQSERNSDEIARESARWLGGYHANLLKGFGLKKKK